ncbi:hypothetical protein K0M31_014791 [Melipona bicolor]|uniref:Uncharacterized protein n=1 Tax=Melipona bicolor TaxID=60889 RepID=A0AA40FH18_9HYME|nr:hypothetical protein K0M31_014791 [Melipona bicolor]
MRQKAVGGRRQERRYLRCGAAWWWCCVALHGAKGPTQGAVEFIGASGAFRPSEMVNGNL